MVLLGYKMRLTQKPCPDLLVGNMLTDRHILALNGHVLDHHGLAFGLEIRVLAHAIHSRTNVHPAPT